MKIISFSYSVALIALIWFGYKLISTKPVIQAPTKQTVTTPALSEETQEARVAITDSLIVKPCQE